MLRRSLLLAALAAVVIGQSASAAQIMGSQGITLTARGQDVAISPGTSLFGATTFTFPSFSLGGQGGDFQLYANGPDNLAGNTLNTANPTAFTFGSTEFGFFTTTSLPLDTNVSGSNSRTIYLFGNFMPGNSPMDPSYNVLTTNTASFVITFNQAGGAGNVISASATLVTPAITIPNGVPEPTTVFAALLGVVPFAVAARRRRLA